MEGALLAGKRVAEQVRLPNMCGFAVIQVGFTCRCGVLACSLKNHIANITRDPSLAALRENLVILLTFRAVISFISGNTERGFGDKASYRQNGKTHHMCLGRGSTLKHRAG